jgi:hypothetical protein
MLSFECKISIHSAENPARQGRSETAAVMMKQIDFPTVAAFEAIELFGHARSTATKWTRIESCSPDRFTRVA